MDGAAISPPLDRTAFDDSYPSGEYQFSLGGMTGDTLVFGFVATRPSEPVGIVDIDAPLQGETTGPQPLLEWSCNGCAGDRLELIVIDQTLDLEVFAGPATHSTGAGDARDGSAVPDPLNLGPHEFQSTLLNFGLTASQTIEPEETSPYEVSLRETSLNANRVAFTIPEPLQNVLAAAALMVLAALRRGRLGRG